MPKERRNRRVIAILACALILVAGGLLFLFLAVRQEGKVKPEPDSTPEEGRVMDAASGPVSAIPDVEGVPPIELALDDLPVAKTAQKKMEIPPIDWRSRLLDGLAEETIEESARNFHEPTDLCLAISTVLYVAATLSTKAQVRSSWR